MYKFSIGNIKIEAANINELKELVVLLGELASEAGGVDLPKHISDFCYAVEVDYQTYHGLDPDNWDEVHREGSQPR